MIKFPVTLFYDIVSPYSYLAFEILTRYQKVWTKMDLQLKPCSIFHIFEEAGNVSPLTISKKSAYIDSDLARLAKLAEIPFVLPVNFRKLAFRTKSNIPWKPLKFLVATDIYTQSKATEAMSRQLWLRIFNNNPAKDISSVESWLEAGKRAQVDDGILHELIIQAEKPLIKAKLRENNDEAIGHGAFGLPSIVIHSPEGPILLFGSDRIELLAHLIGEQYVGPNPLKQLNERR